MKSYSNLKNFKGDSKFSTWIYKIAYYASLDVLKKQKRTINSENIDAFTESDISFLQNGFNNLENEDRKKIINNALLKLSEDERIIVTLFYYEEIPVKEISKIVNLSADNVKTKLFRARKKLVSILKYVIEPNTIDLI